MLKQSDIGKERKFEGYVEKIFKPYPKIVKATFECPSCGSVISVLQTEFYFREPTRCSCGRRSGFKIINTDIEDRQEIIIYDNKTEFDYKVRFEDIKKLKKIREEMGIKLKGIVDLEFFRGSTKGEFTINATEIKHIRRKK